MTKLTGPQEALLARVRAEGVVVQNGRARRTVTALRDAGLVTYEYDVVPAGDGRHGERFTIRLA
jgi:hypothetical protein